MDTLARQILVVDSDHDACARLKDALHASDFAVECCDHGVAATLALARRAYDLLLLDPRTPGVGTIGLLMQARRQPAPPAIVILGDRHGSPNDDLDQMAHGLLLKPCTPTEVRQAVDVALRRRDAQPRDSAPFGTGAGETHADLAHELLYEQVLYTVLVLLGADCAALLVGTEPGSLVAVASASMPPEMGSDTSRWAFERLGVWAIQHAEPTLLQPGSMLPFDIPLQSGYDERASRLCVPLMLGGRALGAIAAERQGEQPFSMADIDRLVPIAAQMAVVLEDTLARHQARQEALRSVHLHRLGVTLLSGTGVEGVVQAVVEHVREALPAAQGYLMLCDGKTSWFERIVPIGDVTFLPTPDELRDAPGLAVQVLADRAPRMRRAADLTYAAPAWEWHLLEFGKQTVLAVPLKTASALYGVLEISAADSPMTEHELQFVDAVASMAAMAIERAQVHAGLARSEARNYALFQQAGDAVFLLDASAMQIIAANPAAQAMSGYNQPELNMLTLGQLIAPTRHSAASADGSETLWEGTREYEGILRTRTGYAVPVSICATTIVDEGMRYQLFVVRNIGEQQRQSQRMAQSEKLAGMNRLTAAVAHEINNPLQALQNTLHLLLKPTFTAEKREQLLHMAQIEVDRLAAMVRRMLELHRPAHEDMRPVSVHSLLEGALASVALQIQQHHVLLERDWAINLPRVLGIGGHLKQVFLDLVTNAVEAMPNGGRLRIRTRIEEGESVEAGPRVLIDFTDNGPGIAEGEVKLVFEPFYSTKRTNTGLGLAICYSIVERHGGVLSVISNGDGTTFRIVLPAAIAPSPFQVATSTR